MNSRNCIQLILFVLLGYLARANPGMYMPYHESSLKKIEQVSVNATKDGFKPDQATYTSNFARSTNRRIKVRFRAASFINITPVTVPGLSDGGFSIIESLALTGNMHLPPFYYIFLFRLTPF